MDLNSLYTLPRSGRYASPLNSNDRLPIVYGDLTDGTTGVWELPCIDTGNYVYCFAAHEVMSVGEGNSVAIYVDGVLENGANYTFDESNDYESAGVIATITFTSDQGNSVVSARGKGKDNSGTLIDNIVDIVFDFLTVENDLTAADFDSTAKSLATLKFDDQSYAAAGVINKDAKGWDILADMMGSFIGSVYYNAEKKLVLSVDDNTTPVVPTAYFSKNDIVTIQSSQKLDNLINRCPCNYGYNYVQGRFAGHTDAASDADTSSVNLYGTQTPKTPYQFYWCRDLTSVQVVQALVVTKFKKPAWIVKILTQGFRHVNIDTGDTINVSIDTLYDTEGNKLINEFLKVLSIRPFPQRNTIEFTCQSVGAYKSIGYLADGTYLADGSITAGNERDLVEV